MCECSAIGAIALNLPHLAHFEADYVRGVPVAAFGIGSDEDNRNLHEDRIFPSPFTQREISWMYNF